MKIRQWGMIGLSDNDWEGEMGPYSFPTSFVNSCFLVLPVMGNRDHTNPTAYDSFIQQRKWNNNQFWIYQQRTNGNNWFDFGNYIAIGI